MKFKKGDQVKIVSGKDKGKTGKIEKVFPKESKVLVTGVNQYKRHLKARSEKQPAEIVTLTKPLPVSNTQLICPKCKLLTRAQYSFINNKKVRLCAKCKKEL